MANNNQIKYVIVLDNGGGKNEFLELFNNNWGIVGTYTTGNAVHFVMKDMNKTQFAIPTDKASVNLPGLGGPK